jgi:hypothetical protein
MLAVRLAATRLLRIDFETSARPAARIPARGVATRPKGFTSFKNLEVMDSTIEKYIGRTIQVCWNEDVSLAHEP